MKEKQAHTETQNKLEVNCRQKKWGGEKQEQRIKRYKLLCIKQISYKDIMYTTGNTVNRYFIITLNGV